MRFENRLTPARLISRYKRFLFDAELETGEIITGSCPNTGSMAGLTTPGSKIWLQIHDNPKRKYSHSFELIEADGEFVGINTSRPNKLTEEAILGGMISSLANYQTLKREQNYGHNSRIDILLSDPDKGLAYVEVKNVHFCRNRPLAEFPDSVTSRGAKHLEELGDMVEAGHRAVMVYLVQRGDCDRLRICREFDPAYGTAFDRAMKRGVEACAIRCKISPEQIIPDALIGIEEDFVNNTA